MTDPHVSPDRLLALRLGELPGEESRTLLNHVATCAVCQRVAQEALNVRADGREVARMVATEDHGTDGTYRTNGTYGTVESHGATHRSYRSHSSWVALAAVLAGIAVATPVLLRQHPPASVSFVVAPPAPQPTPSTPAPPPARPAVYAAIVREALAGALQAPAVLQSLQPAPDRFRSREEGGVELPDLSPFAEILETDRPTFRWPETPGATYTVLVGELGRIVAQSGPLTSSTWRPEAALARGRTYNWQVEIRSGGEAVMLPMPPAPPVRFHVLDVLTKTHLDEARRRAPDDHLLLGILYARAGLRDAALSELSAVTGDDAPHARRLREAIREWPSVHR